MLTLYTKIFLYNYFFVRKINIKNDIEITLNVCNNKKKYMYLYKYMNTGEI